MPKEIVKISYVNDKQVLLTYIVDQEYDIEERRGVINTAVGDVTSNSNNITDWRNSCNGGRCSSLNDNSPYLLNIGQMSPVLYELVSQVSIRFKMSLLCSHLISFLHASF